MKAAQRLIDALSWVQGDKQIIPDRWLLMLVDIGGAFFTCLLSRNLQTFLSLNVFHWSFCGGNLELAWFWPLWEMLLWCGLCAFRSSKSLPASPPGLQSSLWALREVKELALLCKVFTFGVLFVRWGWGENALLLSISLLEDSQLSGERNWKGREWRLILILLFVPLVSPLPYPYMWCLIRICFGRLQGELHYFLEEL